jgi:iron complex transport system substrate-binding protein
MATTAPRNRRHRADTFRLTAGAVLIGAFLMAACSGEAPVPELPAGAAARRIVVMAPAATGMLETVGALDQVVGIGDFVTEPASIADLPRVGAYDAPNVERLLSLESDLFITTSSEAAAPAHRRLETLGVEVLALDTSTFDGVFASLERVGRLLGREQRARDAAQSMRDELESIRERAAGAEPRRVLFVVGRDPLYVAGPGSHADEMIVIAGGINVAADSLGPYQLLSLEAVLERMPDVIVDTSDNRPDAVRGRVAGEWGRWEFLPAVRDGRIYQVAPERLVIPGVRLPEMTGLMGRLIHPEIFGEAQEPQLRAPATDGKAP